MIRCPFCGELTPETLAVDVETPVRSVSVCRDCAPGHD